ncbi:MAG TPA: hypothetical protein VFE23_06480 [Usitatibacter sp.]|jgi:hypothetical protein|nr:hypothetical protein [Usitatibacter sp.]
MPGSRRLDKIPYPDTVEDDTVHRFVKWRSQFQLAQTAKAISDLIADYLQVLPSTAIAQLPGSCQDALKDPDIQAAAITLLQCEMRHQGTPESLELLHEIAHTFAAASIRLSQLEGRGEPLGATSSG